MWKMKDGKKQHANATRKKTAKIFTKAAVIALLGIGLTFNVAHAAEDELATIFHVYLDGEHVGTVDDKETIEGFVNDMLVNEQEKVEGFSLTTAQEITYVPEKVFDPSTDEEQITEALDSQLTVKAKAYQLKIGDDMIGPFKSKQAAEDVLTKYKQKYVDTDSLEKLAEEESADTDLAAGESVVKKVKLSEEISYVEDKADFGEILDEKQAMDLLQKGTAKETVHYVKEGEVLGEIASKYNLDIDELLKLNPDLTEESLLQIDQEIQVTNHQPFLHVIAEEEAVEEETIAYEQETVDSDKLYKGETEVKQEGKTGTKEVTYAIEKKNGQIVSKQVIDEKTISEPVKEIVIKGTKVKETKGSGSFQWPAVGGSITSHVGQRWGSHHKGIDIAGVSNRSILAADNGVVVSAGWDGGGYGNKVIIDHKNGYRTVYAHLASISTSAGQTVTKGSKIGVMGSTGNSTGVHLHFEVYKNGSLQNPANLF
ncbi:M23 family metallopeptidase [Sediminibacillus albus]|uniref:Murein DD-endopeptidase MepM and murein hydrolase activator NlpD, contain LysM domain n=1 Tax=Sediminibacillus albus TaxID=407036 RepID=A0A1G9A555_9BACI|nr:M23 family metallopeptidase [Sediminibacillus albus]SDK22492.1 Murein DD-endopeptidase MepM and murein hydrolase activator NlpD, contain LysM domain [Sediminibacillus albus]